MLQLPANAHLASFQISSILKIDHGTSAIPPVGTYLKSVIRENENDNDNKPDLTSVKTFQHTANSSSFRVLRKGSRAAPQCS